MVNHFVPQIGSIYLGQYDTHTARLVTKVYDQIFVNYDDYNAATGELVRYGASSLIVTLRDWIGYRCADHEALHEVWEINNSRKKDTIQKKIKRVMQLGGIEEYLPGEN